MVNRSNQTEKCIMLEMSQLINIIIIKLAVKKAEFLDWFLDLRNRGKRMSGCVPMYGWRR